MNLIDLPIMSKQYTILAVDDENINLTLMEGLLSDKYTVITLDNGKACLQQFAEINPDILLLDVDMPELSGIEVARELGKLGTKCIIVFVSAKGSIEERLQGYAVGGYDYVVKPFDGHELLNKLELITNQIAKQMELQTGLESATDAFMTAMTSSSEMGKTLSFISQLHQVENHQQLADLLLGILESFGVTASLFIHSEHRGYYSLNRDTTPIEMQIMDLLKNKGRYYEFDRRMQLNESALSMLVMNMPEDEEIRGRYRDQFHFLVTAADGNIRSLDLAHNVKQKEIALSETIADVGNELQSVEKELDNSIFQISIIMDDLLTDFEKTIPFLALSEEQEVQLMNSLTEQVDKAKSAFDNKGNIKDKYHRILQQLKQLTQKNIKRLP